MFYVYILYSERLGKYYKGFTSNVDQRLKRHNSGLETFTSQGVPWKLILTLPKPTKAEAIILEKKLKNLNRIRLELFIEKYKNKL